MIKHDKILQVLIIIAVVGIPLAIAICYHGIAQTHILKYETYASGNLYKIELTTVESMSNDQAVVSIRHPETNEDVCIMLDKTQTCYADLQLNELVGVLTFVKNGNYEYLVLTKSEMSNLQNLLCWK